MTISINSDEMAVIRHWIQNEKVDGCIALEGTEDDDDLMSELRKTVRSLENKLLKAEMREITKKLNKIDIFNDL